MNKELEEAKKVLNMWNKAEEIVINDEKEFDKKPYIQRKQAIETALNYIDNSISKEAIKEKIKELKNNRKTKYDDYMGYKFESREQQDIDKQINILQELLEGK